MNFADMPPELWDAPIAVNLYGVLNCTHAVIRGMIERRWGRVITIASAVGAFGFTGGVSHYGAGKGGAIAFMRNLAMENAPHGVTANTLAMGLFTQIDDPYLNAVGEALPVGRRGSPDDIAPLCLYMASPESSWFTGQTLHLNGGAFTS
jgi:NAD(P)-dependent dehydrogenase (short-subunit alcohol dehydrogenase family)